MNRNKVKRRDLIKWLGYFKYYDKYYDRLHCDSLTHEQVTQEAFGLRDVYSTKELYNVSKDIERAGNMIKAAETCQWPPSISPD